MLELVKDGDEMQLYNHAEDFGDEDPPLIATLSKEALAAVLGEVARFLHSSKPNMYFEVDLPESEE